MHAHLKPTGRSSFIVKSPCNSSKWLTSAPFSGFSCSNKQCTHSPAAAAATAAHTQTHTLPNVHKQHMSCTPECGRRRYGLKCHAERNLNPHLTAPSHTALPTLVDDPPRHATHKSYDLLHEWGMYGLLPPQAACNQNMGCWCTHRQNLGMSSHETDNEGSRLSRCRLYKRLKSTMRECHPPARARAHTHRLQG